MNWELLKQQWVYPVMWYLVPICAFLTEQWNVGIFFVVLITFGMWLRYGTSKISQELYEYFDLRR